MNERTEIDAKLQDPSAHFEQPHEVVVDPVLTKDQKAEALEVLEQDARQRAQASAEGMTGDEPVDLHDVLAAKGLLDLSPIASAYGVVLKDLQHRCNDQSDPTLRTSLQEAIATLESFAETLPRADAA